MRKQVIGAAIAAAFVLSPALAGPWDAEKAICADAIAAEAGVDSADYEATLKSARDGGVKRLTVSLAPADGGALILGECRISRGEVKSVEIKA